MDEDEFNLEVFGITDEELEAMYEAALSAVLTGEDSGWIHVATERHGSVGMCGAIGEPSAYFAPIFDVACEDFCPMCGYLKAMES